MSKRIITTVVAALVFAVAAPIASADAYGHAPRDVYGHSPRDVYKDVMRDAFRPGGNSWNSIGYGFHSGSSLGAKASTWSRLGY